MRPFTTTQTHCLSFIGTALVAASTVTPAIAQATTTATAQDNSDQVQQITVTAQRREQNLQKTPLSVSAFSAQSMKDRQIDTTIDIAQSVPNVSFTTTLADSSTIAAFIRGAGQSNGGFGFTESAVGIYVDDIYHARLTGTSTEFNDIERVEVLRGPQGTLYGRNNLTGAVKFVRRQADGSTFGTFEGSYGSRNYNNQKGTFSTAIIPDKIAVIVSGFRVHEGNYIDATTIGKKRGARDEYGGRLGISLLGSDHFDGKFNISYTHDKGDGPEPTSFTEGLTERGGSFGDYVSPLKSFGWNNELEADFTGTLDLGFAKLKSISGYINTSNHTVFDVYGGYEATPGVYTVGFKRDNRLKARQFSQEFQLLGDAFDKKLSYILGLYYFREDINQQLNDNILGYQVLPDTIRQKTDSFAAFGQVTYKLTDAVSITGGIRYTDENKKIFGSMSNGLGLAVQTLTHVTNDASFRAVSPKGEADWQIAPGIFTYASISRGFQSGGFNASAVANPVLFVLPYNKQTVTAYEAGTKMDLLDRKVRLNLDYFLNRFSQIQTSAYIGNSQVVQNAGTAIVQGPEAELTIVPIRGLSLFGNLARTFDKYTKLSANTAAARADANDLPRVSKWQAQAGFEGTLPLNGGAAGALHLSGNYSYRSSYNTDAGLAAISEIGAQNLVNGAFGWRSPNKKLDLTLSGKNLANERFYVAGSSYGLNRKQRLVNEPRLVKITATYSF